MGKIILTLDEVRDLVSVNKYKVDSSKRFMSRCIDGRYQNEDGLAAQAFPGADLGELAMILSTARSYGFEIDKEKVYKTLIEVLGGEKNFALHTDSHGDKAKIASGCGHFKQINLDPAAYKLEKEDVEFIAEKIAVAKKAGSEEVVLEGDHMEGAILLLKGDWGVLPRYVLETDQGKKDVEVFVYHQTLTDEKHRELAKKLVEKKAVKFKMGEDDEYLYQVMSEVAENHLMETAKRLAPDLPIFSVVFKEDGSFEISKV